MKNKTSKQQQKNTPKLIDTDNSGSYQEGEGCVRRTKRVKGVKYIVIEDTRFQAVSTQWIIQVSY